MVKLLRKHRYRIIFATVAVIVLAGIYIFYRSYSAPDLSESSPVSTAAPVSAGGKIVPVTIHIADYMTLDEGIRTVGTLLPNEQVELGNEVAGLIDEITFEEGSFVRKGSLLVRINSDDLKNQLLRTRMERDLLKEKLERNRILLERDAISREAFDQIQTDYNMIEADIQLLKIKIGKTEITSPLDGVIGFRDVSVGTYVSSGTLIAVIVDGSKLKLEFSIPEKYNSLARVGAEVSFTVQGSDIVRKAKVYAVDPRVDPQTRTVAMRAMYDNTKGMLTPGMFASVIVGQSQSSSLQVPTQAIVPSANNNSVWVVRNGIAVTVAVTTGVRAEATVEITGGLNPGDSVIVSGLLHLRENSPVQIMN